MAERLKILRITLLISCRFNEKKVCINFFKMYANGKKNRKITKKLKNGRNKIKSHYAYIKLTLNLDITNEGGDLFTD